MSDVAAKNRTVNPGLSQELLQNLQVVQNQERAGNFHKAIQVCNELLIKFPEHPIILHYIGVLNLRVNQPLEAINFLNRAVTANPYQAASFNYLGVAHCQNKDLDEGIPAYKQAIKIDPKLFEAYYNLGIALIQQEKLEEAEQNFEKAVGLNFRSPELHYNLGFLKHQRQDLLGAIEQYRAAWKLNPSYVQCGINLGEALIDTRQFQEAKSVYEWLVKSYQDPNLFEKMAMVYGGLKEYEKAIQCLEKIQDKKEEIYFLLATNYWNAKKYEQSANTYKEALKQYPQNLTFMLSLSHANRSNCYWESHDELIKTLFESINNEDYLYKYAHYYIYGFPFVEELVFAKKIASYYQNKADEIRREYPITPNATMNKKLKIGYLSANVRSHANAYTITNLFPNHDNENYDIYLYSAGKTDNSAVAKELMASAPHFVDLSSSSVLEAVKQICADDIDILVDFTGYNNQFSSSILALKPGKVQIGFMGHCGTRGADFIDYIFIDQTVVPTEDAKYFQEKLIYLPDTFFICSDKITPQEMSRSDLNLPEDKLILTCFNHAQKYEPRSFDAWMKVLAKVPNSILLLWLSNHDYAKKNLIANAAKYGMADRLYFTGDFSKAKHLGRLKQLDLFIDSFDCTAQSTAIDALSIGLPIVTLYGNNVASRGASSILKALGMPELITYSVDEYIEKAVYYATHPNELALLHEKILQNKTTEPLFNSNAFVKKLENAYEMVREQYSNKINENIFIN